MYLVMSMVSIDWVCVVGLHRPSSIGPPVPWPAIEREIMDSCRPARWWWRWWWESFPGPRAAQLQSDWFWQQESGIDMRCPYPWCAAPLVGMFKKSPPPAMLTLLRCPARQSVAWLDDLNNHESYFQKIFTDISMDDLGIILTWCGSLWGVGLVVVVAWKMRGRILKSLNNEIRGKCPAWFLMALNWTGLVPFQRIFK